MKTASKHTDRNYRKNIANLFWCFMSGSVNDHHLLIINDCFVTVSTPVSPLGRNAEHITVTYCIHITPVSMVKMNTISFFGSYLSLLFKLNV